ncbi:Crp/Fnr family transcriptional regulator [Diplocloster modestus]|uniref:Crp/Fnr family transcriptional regulator n=1 Tax=Diplocloster modestus TaxID=2850322 RepID=A0ABS6K9A0_9FIRM|nr:Crp/Fnr family transcriptional regulator [Diplocloster modestus]MBU9727100.1 Crp/Fnr family transcriptional regulator [Diplocloster modestus]
MLSEAEIVYVKETLPFWEELSGQNQKELADAMKLQEFKAGTWLHRGDQDCSGLFLLKSGQIRTYFISETGREITLYRLFERDVCIMTASCMMKNITFEVHIEVEKDTQAYLIPMTVVSKMSDTLLPVKSFLNELMASRFSDVMWVMEQVLFTSFDKRLANFLMEQIAIEDSATLHITQEKIASHLGSAREVVTRMLKYFQQEGVVRLFRGGIEVIDEEELYRRTDPNSYRHRPS